VLWPDNPHDKRKPLSAATHGQNPTLASRAAIGTPSFSNADANPENIVANRQITCVCNGFIAPEIFCGLSRRISLIPFAHRRKI
jgi:hypothetical protein